MSVSALNKVSRLLIVDDEASLRTLFSMALESDDHSTECAVDGGDALKKMDESSFDLVLLDLSMPGMSGLDVLRELRARRDLTTVTIISAYIPGSAILKAIAMGVTEFLGKPVQLQPLRNFVEGQIRNRSNSPLEFAKKAARILNFERAADELKKSDTPLDLKTSIWLELFESLKDGKTVHDLDHLIPRLPLLVHG